MKKNWFFFLMLLLLISCGSINQPIDSSKQKFEEEEKKRDNRKFSEKNNNQSCAVLKVAQPYLLDLISCHANKKSCDELALKAKYAKKFKDMQLGEFEKKVQNRYNELAKSLNNKVLESIDNEEDYFLCENHERCYELDKKLTYLVLSQLKKEYSCK